MIGRIKFIKFCARLHPPIFQFIKMSLEPQLEAVRRLVSSEHPSFPEMAPNLYRISRVYLTEFEACEEREASEKASKLSHKLAKKSEVKPGKVAKSRPTKPRKQELDQEANFKAIAEAALQSNRVVKQAVKVAKSVAKVDKEPVQPSSAPKLDQSSSRSIDDSQKEQRPTTMKSSTILVIDEDPSLPKRPELNVRVSQTPVRSVAKSSQKQPSADVVEYPQESQERIIKLRESAFQPSVPQIQPALPAAPAPKQMDLPKENEFSEDLFCLNCKWKFPATYIFEQKNRHINLCFDGKGAADIEQYRQDVRLLKKIGKEGEESEEEEEEEEDKPLNCHICLMSFKLCSSEFIMEHMIECEENPYAKQLEEFKIPKKRPLTSRREFRKTLKKLKENNEQPLPEPAYLLFPDIIRPE
mmetsp:Transcript_3517/g.7306  ORF Transcript_3517/g.7306 Transcript_3517/m.7306 type:complete len:413 (+) Transcript_3517:1019-2257(+)